MYETDIYVQPIAAIPSTSISRSGWARRVTTMSVLAGSSPGKNCWRTSATGRKILDARNIGSDLEEIGQITAGSLQHAPQVLEHLAGLGADIARRQDVGSGAAAAREDAQRLKRRGRCVPLCLALSN